MILRPVPGFDGFLVTVDGKIKSPWGNWRKPTSKPHGHLYISTKGTSGKQVNLYVHHAVAWAWLGPQPEGTEICHNDGDPTNNHVNNLRYDTHKSNMKDCRKHEVGTILLKNDIPVIRSRLAKGHRHIDIAQDYGVHRSTITKINQGVNWGDF